MQDPLHKVRVKFYSGYKGEETPRAVLYKDKEFPIDQILERRKILDPKTGEFREEYTIKLNGRRANLKICGSGECELVYLS